MGVADLLTNNFGSETTNTLKDENGNIITSGSGYFNNTMYSDTFYLEPGCYSFQIKDSDGDGLSFWANNDGSGSAVLKGVNTVPFAYSELIYNFPVDFGKEITFNFTIGGINTPAKEVDILDPIFEIFPNPSSGAVNLKLQLSYAQDIRINVFDIIGNKIIHKELEKVSLEFIPLDLNNLSPGVYNCTIETDQGIFTEKIIISK